ncbi:MAG TPA: aspartate dehydrogenase [Bacillota bacterium]|nr:aspartate dehydrogenase [Bacillota bacterium]
MNIGIIGAGAIGQFVLQALNKEQDEGMQVKSVFVRDEAKYSHLIDEYKIDLYTDLQTFLDSDIDVVVEAANIEAVQKYIPEALKQKDVVIISIGALADDAFLSEITAIAEKHQQAVYLPSGGIGGLDLLQSANALGDVEKVTLETRKPAQSLIDEVLDKEKVIFSGTASEAIKLFPKNINVSIVLSLAGIGTEQTIVIIVADPAIEKNTHTITIEGLAGKATIVSENSPLEANPKSSRLAVLSIISTLKKLNKRINIF